MYNVKVESWCIYKTLHKPVVWECFQYEERISSSIVRECVFLEVLMNGTVSNKNYDSKLNVVKQQWGGGQWLGRRKKQIRGRVMTLSSYTALLGTRLLFWTHYLFIGFYRNISAKTEINKIPVVLKRQNIS